MINKYDTFNVINNWIKGDSIRKTAIKYKISEQIIEDHIRGYIFSATIFDKDALEKYCRKLEEYGKSK
jgi:hypothetical protein